MFTRPVSEMATRTILLDVGGTFIKCSDGREIPIDSAGTREEIASSLRAAVGDASKVAVAIPGPFDYSAGVFLMKHKFAAVYGEKFADLCHSEQSEESPSFRFIHDVNCMLKGALQDPSLKQYSRIALVALGTGLGFTYAIDGRIQCNEMGSPVLLLWKRPYGDGIVEDYASKRGAMKAWCDVTGKPWPEGQSVKSIAGTPEGKAAFALMGSRLGEALAPVLEELSIECVLMGGQIVKSFSLMERSLRDRLSGVSCLKYLNPLPDLDHSTFNGLRSLL